MRPRTITTDDNTGELWRALVELDQLLWQAMPVARSRPHPPGREAWEGALATLLVAQQAVSDFSGRYHHLPPPASGVERIRGLCFEVENRAGHFIRSQGHHPAAEHVAQLVSASIDLTRRAVCGAYAGCDESA